MCAFSLKKCSYRRGVTKPKVLIKTGKIISREYGSFQWTIQNFRDMWETWCFFTSPEFTYNGLEYSIWLQKLANSFIHVAFTSVKPIPQNINYIPFKLCIDCDAESHSSVHQSISVSGWIDRKNSFAADLNFKEFLSEDLRLPLNQSFNILFWMKEQKGKREDVSENANKHLDEENNSEYERKRENVSENANKHLHKENISEYESKRENISENANKYLNEEKNSECESKRENVSENANKYLNEEKNSECESKRENMSEDAINHFDEEKYSEYETLKKLQKDLEKLFLSKEDCDITLEVQQEEFLVHRAILRARSPVFYAMFSHEMSETRSGVVTISDCNPKTFPDFLMYLYTGNTQHISEKNVCHLYTVSDKYEVEELKGKCSEFMKSHISVETFCDFITLALKHAEEELICAATDFFCCNAVEIIKTVKWQMFLQENSTVGNELFQKALLKQNNI